MKLLVNGKIRELTITDKNGVEWSQDLLGNNTDWSEYKTDEETGLSIVDEEFYDWWDEYIENYTEDEKEMEDLAEEYKIDTDDIKLQIANEMDGRDMEQEHYVKQNIFDAIRISYFTEIEMNESGHDDSMEDYGSELGYYLSNAEKDSYVNYLTENYNIDSEKAIEIQKAVMEEIKHRVTSIK